MATIDDLVVNPFFEKAKEGLPNITFASREMTFRMRVFELFEQMGLQQYNLPSATYDKWGQAHFSEFFIGRVYHQPEIKSLIIVSPYYDDLDSISANRRMKQVSRITGKTTYFLKVRPTKPGETIGISSFEGKDFYRKIIIARPINLASAKT